MAPTPEEIAARGDAILLDLEYWKQVNVDTGRLIDAIAEAAGAVAEATVAAVSVGTFADARVIGFVTEATDANGRAMKRLLELSEITTGIGDLVAGRLRVLEAAIDALREEAA